jgi:hypothetical protein
LAKFSKNIDKIKTRKKKIQKISELLGQKVAFKNKIK